MCKTSRGENPLAIDHDPSRGRDWQATSIAYLLFGPDDGPAANEPLAIGQRPLRGGKSYLWSLSAQRKVADIQTYFRAAKVDIGSKHRIRGESSSTVVANGLDWALFESIGAAGQIDGVCRLLVDVAVLA